VHGRELKDGESIDRFPNILQGDYLDEIAQLESSLAANVTFVMQDKWRSNQTAHIQDEVHFQVSTAFFIQLVFENCALQQVHQK
jgi:hypothetical protein